MTCNRSTTISSVAAALCSLITTIPNICRYFHGTCSSALPPETKVGTRWCHRKLLRSSADAVSSDTRNVNAFLPIQGAAREWSRRNASDIDGEARGRNERDANESKLSESTLNRFSSFILLNSS